MKKERKKKIRILLAVSKTCRLFFFLIVNMWSVEVNTGEFTSLFEQAMQRSQFCGTGLDP